MKTSVDRLFVLVLAFAALLLVGCSSMNSSSVPRGPVRIDIGMTLDEVESLLGASDDMKELDPPMRETIVWVYRYDSHRSRLVQTGSIDVPYINPVTGEHQMLKEPLLTPQVTKHSKIIEIVFNGGRVATWSQRRESESELYE